MTSLVEISVEDQLLRVTDGDRCTVFPVSTALNGAGEQSGSGCTPRGWHRIAAVIGRNQPENTVFVGRRPTGEIFTPELGSEFPERDWILTRIFWLQGLEAGVNRFGDVDSMRRYIYIHGTPDSEPMGMPRSHGCIRMRNRDLLELESMVDANTQVWIQEHSFRRIPCINL